MPNTDQIIADLDAKIVAAEQSGGGEVTGTLRKAKAEIQRLQAVYVAAADEAKLAAKGVSPLKE